MSESFYIKKPTFIDVTGDDDKEVLSKMRELCEEHERDYTVAIRNGCRVSNPDALCRKLQYHTYKFTIRVESGVVTARPKYDRWELNILLRQTGGFMDLSIHPDWPYGHFEKFFRSALKSRGTAIINNFINRYLNGDFNHEL